MERRSKDISSGQSFKGRRRAVLWLFLKGSSSFTISPRCFIQISIYFYMNAQSGLLFFFSPPCPSFALFLNIFAIYDISKTGYDLLTQGHLCTKVMQVNYCFVFLFNLLFFFFRDIRMFFCFFFNDGFLLSVLYTQMGICWATLIPFPFWLNLSSYSLNGDLGNLCKLLAVK